MHHGMNNALWVNQHLDTIGDHRKKETGFDKFQPLVHHGGRIDRYLAPHGPFGMLASLIRGHRSQVVIGGIQERPARAGEYDLLHLIQLFRSDS